MAGGKHSKKKIDIAARQLRAIELRKLGSTFRGIAVVIGKEFDSPKYGEKLAFLDVKAVLQRTLAETTLHADQHIALELERLDEMLLSISAKVSAGDLKAIETALKIMDRRAAFLGLNFAERVKVPETPTLSTLDGIELTLITPNEYSSN